MKHSTTTAGWLLSLILSALLFAQPETPRTVTEGGPSQDAAAPGCVLPGTSPASFPTRGSEIPAPVPSETVPTSQSDASPTTGADDLPSPAPVSFPAVRIRASGLRWNGRQWETVTQEGTAVPLGGGRYATVSHLIDQLQRYTVEVEIDGTWTAGRLVAARGHDAALCAVSADSDSGVAQVDLTSGQYGDSVTVRGLKSAVAQVGTISNDETISLAVHCPGIEQGDSGGGVFDVDGRLVGMIRAKNPNEPRVVYFTPAKFLPTAAPPVAGAAHPRTSPPEGLTVYAPATWTCHWCEVMHGYDWSGFPLPITFEAITDEGLGELLDAINYTGKRQGFPVTIWRATDQTYYVAWGARTPAQLEALWRSHE